MSENIIITDLKQLEILKLKIAQGGAGFFHVLSDFDTTLTTAFVNGKKIPSIISVLRDEKYLTPDYPAKAYALYDKYYPVESDHSLSIDQKKKLMREWWQNHFKLLIESGLNKKDLEKVIASRNVQLRKGAAEFLSFLHQHQIPLVIMSSSGLGGDVISMYLEKQGKLFDNIHIVYNTYQWDDQGRAIGVKEPIIHSMNKDETAIQNFPVFEIIKDRKNVLLLGDCPSDVGMVTGFNYEHLIKVGFLNSEVEKNLEHYKNYFDIIILNDGDMDYVNVLLKEIVK